MEKLVAYMSQETCRLIYAQVGGMQPDMNQPVYWGSIRIKFDDSMALGDAYLTNEESD